MDTPATSTGQSHGRIAMYLMIVAALGLVVFFNYYYNLTTKENDGRLPYNGRIEKDFLTVDHTGKERLLKSLLGKVWVVSQVYTTCPAKCAGMAEEMAKLQAEFSADPRVHFVSWSIFPEHDRPEVIKAWVDARLQSWKSYNPEQWWFLTTKDPSEAEGDLMRKFSSNQFKFSVERNSPEHIAKFPADVWTHGFIMLLVDSKSNVRGTYHPFPEGFDGKWLPRPIRDDIPKLLKEMEDGSGR